MPKLFTILDDRTRFGCFELTNRRITIVLTAFQLVICAISLAQHVFSVAVYGKIFYCRTNFSRPNTSEFLAYDVIIFDFGLFSRLLGMEECVANYLDGGYGRGMWCFNHTWALALLLVFILMNWSKLYLMYPALTIQSSFSFGLCVLTLATLPKLLSAIFGKLTKHLAGLIIVFILGELANLFFTVVLWHYFWHLEVVYKKPKKPKAVENRDTADGRPFIFSSDEIIYAEGYCQVDQACDDDFEHIDEQDDYDLSEKEDVQNNNCSAYSYYTNQ